MSLKFRNARDALVSPVTHKMCLCSRKGSLGHIYETFRSIKAALHLSTKRKGSAESVQIQNFQNEDNSNTDQEPEGNQSNRGADLSLGTNGYKMLFVYFCFRSLNHKPTLTSFSAWSFLSPPKKAKMLKTETPIRVRLQKFCNFLINLNHFFPGVSHPESYISIFVLSLSKFNSVLLLFLSHKHLELKML